MKKISVLFFLLCFLFSYSQTDEFQKADEQYNKRMSSFLKKNPEKTTARLQQERIILEEKLVSYRSTLEKIRVEEQKLVTEVPAPSVPPVSKKPEFELGESKFKELLTSAYKDNIASLHYTQNVLYSAKLSCAVDSKGYVYDVKVKGKNADINTFILAAFYQIKDKGKWKPAEVNGHPILYVFSYPVTIMFDQKESDSNE